MAKGMAINVRVFQILQTYARVPRTNRMQKIAAAGTEGRYFQR
jgi:hypothetical protein